MNQQEFLTFFPVAVVLLGSSPAAHAEETGLYLVKDARAVSAIVVRQDAPQWTNTAAQWLQDYIQKATGAKLMVVTEDSEPEGTLISVGHTKMASKAGIDARSLDWDGCRLVVRKNMLYLLGKDDPLLAKHVHRPEGKPAMVPADDPRPALTIDPTEGFGVAEAA